MKSVSFNRNNTSKSKKTEKRVVKTIEYIYSEPGILILLKISFDFGLLNSSQMVLEWRTTISSLPPKKGWRNRCPPDFLVFIWVSGLFRAGFSKPPYRGCPTPKRAKTAFLIKIGKRFCHFLDTGREMIFDGPSGMSWGLTGEGGDGGWPAAGTEEMTKQPSFS